MTPHFKQEGLRDSWILTGSA